MKQRNLVIVIVVLILAIVVLAASWFVSSRGETRAASYAQSYGGVAESFGDMSERSLFTKLSADDVSLGMMPPIEEPTAGPVGDDIEQRVIKNGSLSLIVESIPETLTSISATAEQHKGFTQNANAGERQDGVKYGSAIIRVPTENFNAAMADLKALAIHVREESVSADDVTEQYTDLQARLSAAKEEERAYLRLLDRAGSVADLLQVQRELSNVRARIESLQGQIQYLENQTDYSTISVSLEEEVVIQLPTKPFRPGSTFMRAVQMLVALAQWAVNAVIWLVVIGVGVGVPVGIVYVIVRKIRRRS